MGLAAHDRGKRLCPKVFRDTGFTKSKATEAQATQGPCPQAPARGGRGGVAGSVPVRAIDQASPCVDRIGNVGQRQLAHSSQVR